MNVLAFVGTYTDGKRTGIHLIATDTETGKIHPVSRAHDVANATYLARSRTRPILYATQGLSARGPGARRGSVATYRIEGDTLTPLSQRPVGGTVPCHLSLDPGETALAFAEYTNAVSGVFELTPDGDLADTPPVTVTHAGSGPDADRQEKAHAHCATVTPDGRFLCIADLGMDRVLAYDWIRRREGLLPVPALTITSAGGAGPRHLVFHPNGRLAFLLHELDNTVTALRYTGESFIPVQTRRTLPVGFRAFSKAAAIKLSADGRFLLASNRGHDSIAAFAVDSDTGRLDPLARSRLVGAFPRDFAFVPGEAFILVGHETSNTVYSYAFDAATGRLEPACGPYKVHRPVCILFGESGCPASAARPLRRRSKAPPQPRR